MPTPHVPQSNKMWCCTVGAAAVTTCITVTPLSTLDGSNIGSVLVIQDVTESRKMLRQLSYSASHDALTHLANRASFEKQLRMLLQTVNSTHQRHALCLSILIALKR